MLEGESVVIRLPDREAGIEWLEGQYFLGRIIPFFVIVKTPTWMAHARIIQGPFHLNRLYTFGEEPPL
jgi:hypothetical protein